MRPAKELFRHRVPGGVEAPSRSRQAWSTPRFLGPLTAVAVVAALTTGGELVGNQVGSDPATRASSSSPPESGQRSETSGVVTYSSTELVRLGDRLLEASKYGDVAEVAFVRAADDRSGLTVAVPQATWDRYGQTELQEQYSALVGIPTYVEIGEMPKIGLPIKPS